VTPSESTLSAVLKRDNLIVGSALFLLTLLAWASVLWFAAQMKASATDMSDMPGMAGMNMSGAMAPGFWPGGPAHFLFMFAMWSVMMIGMMTPSASPMILIYGQVARQARTLGRDFASAGWFATGYLLGWTLFALVATTVQYGLDRVALLTPMMASANRFFGAAVLIAAGLYQWTPLKDSCLTQCRAPLSFVQRHGGFRSGILGSLRLGALHGAYCIGCCWALMALLFVIGVMNLFWIAALMILVLLEKILPGGRMLGRLAGLAAVVGGVWLLVM
jgi:predicted metal-binding membrane protein